MGGTGWGGSSGEDSSSSILGVEDVLHTVVYRTHLQYRGVVQGRHRGGSTGRGGSSEGGGEDNSRYWQAQEVVPARVVLALLAHGPKVM
jgi:hypothetical protein